MGMRGSRAVRPGLRRLLCRLGPLVRLLSTTGPQRLILRLPFRWRVNRKLGLILVLGRVVDICHLGK